MGFAGLSVDGLLPSGPPVRARTMAIAFGLWPLALVMLLRGTEMGLGTVGLMVAPFSLGAFKRLRDLFPPSPGRRVVTGYAGLYLLLSAWIVVAHFDALGLLLLAAVAWASSRAWLRPDDAGVPTLEAQANRAALAWQLAHSEDPGRGDPGRDGDRPAR